MVRTRPVFAQTVTIIKLFSLFNYTRDYIDSTRPAPSSMIKLITEYWNSYMKWNSLINIKFL